MKDKTKKVGEKADHSPCFEIVADGKTYSVHSDSPAASLTGGVAISGLSKDDVLKIVERLKAHGRKVKVPKGIK